MQVKDYYEKLDESTFRVAVDTVLGVGKAVIEKVDIADDKFITITIPKEVRTVAIPQEILLIVLKELYSPMELIEKIVYLKPYEEIADLDLKLATVERE